MIKKGSGSRGGKSAKKAPAGSVKKKLAEKAKSAKINFGEIVKKNLRMGTALKVYASTHY
jgi:hypothetical protein